MQKKPASKQPLPAESETSGSRESESISENRRLNIGLVLALAVLALLATNLIGRFASPRPDPTRVFNPNELLGDIIQVDVRNGRGESGLAAIMTDYLRDYGFDVIEHGDHTNFDVDSTMVIDRIGNKDAAVQVALALNIARDRVISDVDEDLYLDVSVIIGADYESIQPFRDRLEEDDN